MFAFHGREESKKNNKKVCDARCINSTPICFIQLSRKCNGHQYTAKWNHLTTGEHFCNQCFECLYRVKPRNVYWQRLYQEWKRNWTKRMCELTEPSLKDFVANRYLSHWARCSSCCKWRLLGRKLSNQPPDPQTLHTFVCQKTCKFMENPCDLPEDERVAMVKSDPEKFMSSTKYLVLLEYSAAHEFLLPYPFDRVGIAPNAKPISTDDIDTDWIMDEDVFDEDVPPQIAENPPKPKGVAPYFHPFQMPNESGKASALEPDKPQQVEMTDFPEFNKHPDLYLGLRNLLLSIWYRNPKRWITVDLAASFTCVRGLMRIAVVESCLSALINFLTCKGLINTGLLVDPPNGALLPSPFNRERVIVVGAGIGGLAAARQLHNFGSSVIVLEATGRIGGRVKDFEVPGSSPPAFVPLGAGIIPGCVNNPIVLLAHQAGLPLRTIPSWCVLLDPNGRPIDTDLDSRLEFHVEALLNRIACEKRALLPGQLKAAPHATKSLQDVFDEAEAEVLPLIKDLECNDLERGLMEFHLAELDLSLGGGSVSLSSLPWIVWDCHALHLEFPGARVAPRRPSHSLSALTGALAKGVDVRLNSQVVSISLGEGEEDDVAVTLREGEEESVLQASKVIVSVPPSALSAISISPPLPSSYTQSDSSSPPFLVVSMGFKSKFWSHILASNTSPDGRRSHHFAALPTARHERGFCHTFRDIFPENEDLAVLQTQIFGEASTSWSLQSDSDIAASALSLLASLFPSLTPDVVTAVWTKVTRWTEAYSLAGDSNEPFMNKICFAGEKQSWDHPMSLAGAYLSGVLEAGRIADMSASRDMDC